MLRLLTHVFCLFALAVACGSPEALHETLHALTNTVCEAQHSGHAEISRASAQSSADASVEVGAVEVGAAAVDSGAQTCLLSQCTAAMSHHAGKIETFVVDHVQAIAVDSVFPRESLLSSHLAIAWASPRGPPHFAS